VREAVHSVREREPVEVVVVDDKGDHPPTDSVLEELESDGITVKRHARNLGAAAARTTGLHASSAPLVFPLDADDLAVAGHLALLADRLEAEPQAQVVFGDYEEFGERRLVRGVPSRLDPFRLAHTNEYPVTALFRRTLLEEIGGFSPAGYQGRSYEDWNLWLTVAEGGERGLHAGRGVITYRRRLHGERKLQSGKQRHRELYAQIRAAHPAIYGRLAEHRRRSDLPAVRKLLYPYVYGGRRRFPTEQHAKNALDRAGIWTLRR